MSLTSDCSLPFIIRLQLEEDIHIGVSLFKRLNSRNFGQTRQMLGSLRKERFITQPGVQNPAQVFFIRRPCRTQSIKIALVAVKILRKLIQVPGLQERQVSL